MTTVRTQVMIIGTLGLLAAAGCQDRQPFDMAVVHRSKASVFITHPSGSTGGRLAVNLAPVEDGGCYEVPGDLRITVNGVPAASLDLHEETIGDAPMSPCGGNEHTTLTGTLTMVDTTQPVTIDIAQGTDHAVMVLQPLPHPPLTLTPYVGTLGGGADDGETTAELIPLSGDPSDVGSDNGCWNAWLCPPGSETSCATPVNLDVRTTPSAAGVLLALRFSNQSPGDRSLWVAGSEDAYCRAPAVSECSGVATCEARSDNDGYLLGPYPLELR